MLIDCHNGKKRFIINKSELDLEGSLITCEYCKEEWIYESRTRYLENKLAQLDLDLNKKEINLNEQNDKHNQPLSSTH